MRSEANEGSAPPLFPTPPLSQRPSTMQRRPLIGSDPNDWFNSTLQQQNQNQNHQQQEKKPIDAPTKPSHTFTAVAPLPSHLFNGFSTHQETSTLVKPFKAANASFSPPKSRTSPVSSEATVKPFGTSQSPLKSIPLPTFSAPHSFSLPKAPSLPVVTKVPTTNTMPFTVPTASIPGFKYDPTTGQYVEEVVQDDVTQELDALLQDSLQYSNGEMKENWEWDGVDELGNTNGYGNKEYEYEANVEVVKQVETGPSTWTDWRHQEKQEPNAYYQQYQQPTDYPTQHEMSSNPQELQQQTHQSENDVENSILNTNANENGYIVHESENVITESVQESSYQKQYQEVSYEQHEYQGTQYQVEQQHYQQYNQGEQYQQYNQMEQYHQYDQQQYQVDDQQQYQQYNQQTNEQYDQQYNQHANEQYGQQTNEYGQQTNEQYGQQYNQQYNEQYDQQNIQNYNHQNHQYDQQFVQEEKVIDYSNEKTDEIYQEHQQSEQDYSYQGYSENTQQETHHQQQHPTQEYIYQGQGYQYQQEVEHYQDNQVTQVVHQDSHYSSHANHQFDYSSQQNDHDYTSPSQHQVKTVDQIENSSQQDSSLQIQNQSQDYRYDQSTTPSELKAFNELEIESIPLIETDMKRSHLNETVGKTSHLTETVSNTSHLNETVSNSNHLTENVAKKSPLTEKSPIFESQSKVKSPIIESKVKSPIIESKVKSPIIESKVKSPLIESKQRDKTTKLCPLCHQDNSLKANFCSTCGAPLKQVTLLPYHTPILIPSTRKVLVFTRTGHLLVVNSSSHCIHALTLQFPTEREKYHQLERVLSSEKEEKEKWLKEQWERAEDAWMRLWIQSVRERVAGRGMERILQEMSTDSDLSNTSPLSIFIKKNEFKEAFNYAMKHKLFADAFILSGDWHEQSLSVVLNFACEQEDLVLACYYWHKYIEKSSKIHDRKLPFICMKSLKQTLITLMELKCHGRCFHLLGEQCQHLFKQRLCNVLSGVLFPDNEQKSNEIQRFDATLFLVNEIYYSTLNPVNEESNEFNLGQRLLFYMNCIDLNIEMNWQSLIPERFIIKFNYEMSHNIIDNSIETYAIQPINQDLNQPSNQDVNQDYTSNNTYSYSVDTYSYPTYNNDTVNNTNYNQSYSNYYSNETTNTFDNNTYSTYDNSKTYDSSHTYDTTTTFDTSNTYDTSNTFDTAHSYANNYDNNTNSYEATNNFDTNTNNQVTEDSSQNNYYSSYSNNYMNTYNEINESNNDANNNANNDANNFTNNTLNEDVDDLGFGNNSLRKNKNSNSDGQNTNDTPPDNKNEKTLEKSQSKSWLFWPFKAKSTPTSPSQTPTQAKKANLGDENSFRYDPIQKKWISSSASSTNATSSTSAPPPPSVAASPIPSSIPIPTTPAISAPNSSVPLRKSQLGTRKSAARNRYVDTLNNTSNNSNTSNTNNFGNVPFVPVPRTAFQE